MIHNRPVGSRRLGGLQRCQTGPVCLQLLIVGHDVLSIRLLQVTVGVTAYWSLQVIAMRKQSSELEAKRTTSSDQRSTRREAKKGRTISMPALTNMPALGLKATTRVGEFDSLAILAIGLRVHSGPGAGLKPLSGASSGGLMSQM
jgi:hypothetical protein